MSNNHSTLHSPSGAWLRRLCPGSARAQAQVPNEDNKFMLEGRDAHHVAEKVLMKRNLDGVDLDNLSHEMVNASKIYAKHVLAIAGNNLINIESRLNISNIHPDCFGTCDAWYYDEANKQVHIWDFKYGRKAIEVKENWQMIEYAAGVEMSIRKNYLRKIGGLKNDDSIIEYGQFLSSLNFNFHIIQPRAKHENGIIRSWSIIWPSLNQLFYEAIEFEELAEQENAPLAAGDHCQNCRARFVCQTFKDAAVIASVALRNGHLELNGMPDLSENPQDISNELTYLREASIVLDTRIKTLTEQAMSVIKQGQSIPGYKLMPTLSRSTWNISGHVIEELGAIHGCNLIKPKEPITPSQAIAAGMPYEIVNMNCSKEITGEKLVEDNENS